MYSKGTFINDIQILGVFFEPLPPLARIAVAGPLLLKSEFHEPPPYLGTDGQLDVEVEIVTI